MQGAQQFAHVPPEFACSPAGRRCIGEGAPARVIRGIAARERISSTSACFCTATMPVPCLPVASLDDSRPQRQAQLPSPLTQATHHQSCRRRLSAIARTVQATPAFAAEPEPFLPAPLLPGGIVRPLFKPTDTSFVNASRLHEPEVYNGGQWQPGDKIHGITNIHNPSFDIYLSATGPASTGCCVILVPGGGHRVLGVGGCTDLVTLFAARGISTAIVRCRLRIDGCPLRRMIVLSTDQRCNVLEFCTILSVAIESLARRYDMAVDALNDTLRCISLIRANSAEWRLDPDRIGVVGMSAGAEHAAGAATEYEAFTCSPALAHQVSARPDFVGVLFSGPTLFEHDPALDSEGGGRYAGMSERGAAGQATNDAQTADER